MLKYIYFKFSAFNRLADTILANDCPILVRTGNPAHHRESYMGELVGHYLSRALGIYRVPLENADAIKFGDAEVVHGIFGKMVRPMVSGSVTYPAQLSGSKNQIKSGRSSRLI